MGPTPPEIWPSNGGLDNLGGLPFSGNGLVPPTQLLNWVYWTLAENQMEGGVGPDGSQSHFTSLENPQVKQF